MIVNIIFYSLLGVIWLVGLGVLLRSLAMTGLFAQSLILRVHEREGTNEEGNYDKYIDKLGDIGKSVIVRIFAYVGIMTILTVGGFILKNSWMQ